MKGTVIKVLKNTDLETLKGYEGHSDIQLKQVGNDVQVWSFKGCKHAA